MRHGESTVVHLETVYYPFPQWFTDNQQSKHTQLIYPFRPSVGLGQQVNKLFRICESILNSNSDFPASSHSIIHLLGHPEPANQKPLTLAQFHVYFVFHRIRAPDPRGNQQRRAALTANREDSTKTPLKITQQDVVSPTNVYSTCRRRFVSVQFPGFVFLPPSPHHARQESETCWNV